MNDVTNTEKDKNMNIVEVTQTKAPWVFGARDNRHRGVEVDSDGKMLTVSQAIEQGGLDWLVELRDPISDDQDTIPAPDWRQVVKIEDILKNGAYEKVFRTLGMVKGRYTVLQNRDAFKFFDNATLTGAAVIQAVGHLDFGRVVWAVAQRPETVELYPGDVVHQNLVLLTAHDGSHAVKVMFTPYRSATGTMLGYKTARRMRTEVRVRHTKSIDAKMGDLHNVLDAEAGFFDRWRTALVGTDSTQGFKQQIVTDDQVQRVVAGLFPSKKKIDEDGQYYDNVSTKAKNARQMILDRIDEQAEVAKQAYTDAGQESPNGTTQLDVFLGVSEFIAKDRKAKNEGNNWVVSTFGTGANMRQKAFDLIAGL